MFYSESQRGASDADSVRKSDPPNGWPMCRRIGCAGLMVGEVGAVGTIGLLDTPLPSFTVARSAFGVSNHHDEDALWLVTVENEVRKPPKKRPAHAEIDRPAIRRFDNQSKRRLEFLPKARCYARVSFRVPRRSLLALGNGERVQLKGFHDARSPQ